MSCAELRYFANELRSDLLEIIYFYEPLHHSDDEIAEQSAYGRLARVE